MQNLQKKYGRLFATHSFTNSTPSLAFVLYWAFSWWNCSPWPWLAWEFTSTTLKMAHFHAIWHQQQMLPPLQVSHNELKNILMVHSFFFAYSFTRFFFRNVRSIIILLVRSKKRINSKTANLNFQKPFYQLQKALISCLFIWGYFNAKSNRIGPKTQNSEWDVGIVEYQNK